MAIIKPNNNTISAITALPAAITTGSLVHINTQTVSGAVSSVNFDNQMSSTYDNYVIFFHKVGHDHAGNAVMRSQLGHGSTPTYLTGNVYKFTYIYHQAQSDGTDTINGAGVGGSTSYFQYGLTNRSSTSNGSIFLTGMNNTGGWQKGVRSDYFHHGQYANDFEHAYMSCVANDTNATTSIKFFFSSGDVSSGVFTLYGVSKT